METDGQKDFTQTVPEAEAPDRIEENSGDPRIRPVTQLAELCDYEATHTQQVTRLALRLFDELQFLHQMGAKERFWLQAGSLLHDIGWIEGGRSHQKTSMRIILTTPMLPFSNKERLIIGSIARYHRKSLPKLKHDNYAALTPDERRQTAVLASFLRLANGLDSDHSGLIQDLKCQVTNDEIMITALAQQSPEPLLLIAALKCDLLKKVFNRKIELIWEQS